LECHDYDLCAACNDKGALVHSKSHIVLCIPKALSDVPVLDEKPLIQDESVAPVEVENEKPAPTDDAKELERELGFVEAVGKISLDSLTRKRETVEKAMLGLRQQLEERRNKLQQDGSSEVRAVFVPVIPSPTASPVSDSAIELQPVKTEEEEEIIASAPASVKGVSTQTSNPVKPEETTIVTVSPVTEPTNPSMSTSNLSFPRLQLSTENLTDKTPLDDDAQTQTMTPSEDDVHSLAETDDLSLNDDHWSDDGESFHSSQEDSDDDFELLDVESITDAKEDENSQQLAQSMRS
jgi:hypothetical protein